MREGKHVGQRPDRDVAGLRTRARVVEGDAARRGAVARLDCERREPVLDGNAVDRPAGWGDRRAASGHRDVLDQRASCRVEDVDADDPGDPDRVRTRVIGRNFRELPGRCMGMRPKLAERDRCLAGVGDGRGHGGEHRHEEGLKSHWGFLARVSGGAGAAELPQNRGHPDKGGRLPAVHVGFATDGESGSNRSWLALVNLEADVVRVKPPGRGA